MIQIMCALTHLKKKIIITDKEEPTLTCPVNMEVNTDEGSDEATGVQVPDATGVDNVDKTVSVSSDAPTAYSLGDNVVTFSATDAAGNTGTCTVTVTVLGKFYMANIQIQISISRGSFFEMSISLVVSVLSW